MENPHEVFSPKWWEYERAEFEIKNIELNNKISKFLYGGYKETLKKALKKIKCVTYNDRWSRWFGKNR